MISESRKKFVALLYDLMKEMGGEWQTTFPDRTVLLQEQNIILEFLLGDAKFRLSHCIDPDIEKYLHIDSFLGELPVGQEEQMMFRLLELNYELAALQPAGYGIDPETGWAVQAHIIPIEGQTGMSIYAMLSGLDEHARVWRSGAFLEPNLNFDLTGG